MGIIKELPSTQMIITIADETHVIPMRWLRDIIAGRIETDVETCALFAAIILSMMDE